MVEKKTLKPQDMPSVEFRLRGAIPTRAFKRAFLVRDSGPELGQ